MSEENIVADQNVEGAENSETPNFPQEEEGVQNSEIPNSAQGEEDSQNPETPNIENDEEGGHAATIETLQQRLLTALVEADGRLQDPTDFPFNPDFLDDKDSLTEAIGNLIEAKPHLKKKACKR